MDIQSFEAIRRNFDLKTLPMFLNMTRGNGTSLGEEMASLMREMKRSAESDHTFASSTRVTLIILYTIMALVGLGANIFISVVILFSKKLLKNPSNVLVLNLMASGILMSIFCIPFTLIGLTYRSWIFGSFFCKLIPSLQSTSIFVCSATIAMISVDRLVRVTRNVPSHSYNRVFARTHWIIMSIETSVIWLLSAGVSIPIACYQSIIQIGSKDVGYEKCVELWPSESVKGIYAVTFMVVHYLGPSLILLFCHLEIKGHLESNLRSSDGMSSMNGTNQSGQFDPNPDATQSDQGPEMCYDHQLEMTDCNLSLPAIALEETAKLEGTISGISCHSNGDISKGEVLRNLGVSSQESLKFSDSKLTASDHDLERHHSDRNHNSRYLQSTSYANNHTNGTISNGHIRHQPFKVQTKKCIGNELAGVETKSQETDQKFQNRQSHDQNSPNCVGGQGRGQGFNRCQSTPELNNHANYYMREINRNRQVTKTLVYIILCFIITWLPWNLFNIFLDFEPDPKMSISDIYLVLAICHLIAMTTIPLNAFWYGWANPNIRVEALKFLEKLSLRFRPGNNSDDGHHSQHPGVNL